MNGLESFAIGFRYLHMSRLVLRSRRHVRKAGTVTAQQQAQSMLTDRCDWLMMERLEEVLA